MTSYKPAYDSDRVRQVFGNLSIDKARLPSSGLTKIGVPSFVAEWLLRYRDWETDRKSTRLNSSHSRAARMPSSA